MSKAMQTITSIGVATVFNHNTSRWGSHYTAHLVCGHSVSVKQKRKLGSKTHCVWCDRIEEKQG